ncbi:non-ribosomal peptide synthetase [Gluconacetobacter sacchari]|uniref:AMP-binding protein n=1 Tax=Gluconacetobacter sacchari TaxID=92759 RepID=A0A7W4IGE5_9PROT|nr:non-ribosomal peptide synthetase [Gluconacetobacter sacchari]MBB2162438.1 AMP-binding protein [Gluconacetobacter sacchari]
MAYDVPITGTSVLSLILDCAATNRDSIAVIHGRNSLTYSELVACAYYNATRLKEVGVAKGTTLLCAAPTGVQLPISWLSSMMLGAIFIPVDPGWPQHRVEEIISTSTPAAILTTGSEERILNYLHDANFIKIETKLNGDSSEWEMADLSTGDIMYGFFTSGTTGSAKCALNIHGGVQNRFQYMTRRFGHGHVAFQNSSPCFDSSIWQLLWPLASGGSVVLPDERRAVDVISTVALIEKHRATITDFVPSLFRLLVKSLNVGTVKPEQLTSLRHILIGGEAADGTSIRDFMRHVPNCALVNTYGHTEASIGMVFHDITREDLARIPLGSPIDNTFVLVVDKTMAPVPDGEVGEIVVGGACVGRGYLGQPELTSRCFLPNPYEGTKGETVYRTGDYGRMNGKGLLEYVGRSGDQIKVFGVRVELEDVASAAKRTLPEIEQAIPLVISASEGNDILCLAYVGEKEYEPSLMRQNLSSCLPLTHVPKYFLRLGDLPLSDNGKIDKKVIHAIFESKLNAVRQDIGHPQETSVPGRVYSSFARVLGRRKFPTDANFFDIGGSSLDAINLAIDLEQSTGFHLDVSTVYRYPSVRALADYLQRGGTPEAPDNEITLPILDHFRVAEPVEPRGRPKTILITGATGFVGASCLANILRETSYDVYTIARADDSLHANARVWKELHQFEVNEKSVASRLTVIKGDLAAERFGLDHQTFEQLLSNIDEVIHCASEVNFLKEPDLLYRSNVTATEKVLRFCGMVQAKRLHHISSLAVVPFHPQSGDSQIKYSAGVGSGYGVTKYLAEVIVKKAKALGLEAEIYRLDDVLPSAVFGYRNKRSIFDIFVRTCLREGVYPAEAGEIRYLSTDQVSEMIVNRIGLTDWGAPEGSTIQVVSPIAISIEQMLLHAAQRRGLLLRQLPYQEFLHALEVSSHSDSKLLKTVIPEYSTVVRGRRVFEITMVADQPGSSGKCALPVADGEAIRTGCFDRFIDAVVNDITAVSSQE